jgi:hypothetical protein
VTNPTTSPPNQPCVGIFWGVPRSDGTVAIVVDAVVLDEAEPYGDFLTHPRGHYEVWEAWRNLRKSDLADLGIPETIRAGEYEEFPRGRVVYEPQTRQFTIYADRKLQTENLLKRIALALGLESQRWIIRSDAHYRS